MLNTQCEHCGHRLAYDGRHAGKTAQCPKCGERVLLSGPKDAPVTEDFRKGDPSPTGDASLGQALDSNEGEKRQLRILGIFFASLMLLGLAAALTYCVTRDTWEQESKQRVMARLEQAERTQEADALAAFQSYDEVLRESAGHRVKDLELIAKLDAAKAARDRLRRLLDERQQIDARREADRRREEGARQAAQRKAQEEEEQEKEAVRALVTKWRNVPKVGREAYNAVKRIQARTEVGVSQSQYAEIVGEAWADVKRFADSPEGKEFPELTHMLLSAMKNYRTAAEFFHDKPMVQASWLGASNDLKYGDALMSSDLSEKDLVNALSTIRIIMRADAKH